MVKVNESPCADLSGLQEKDAAALSASLYDPDLLHLKVALSVNFPRKTVMTETVLPTRMTTSVVSGSAPKHNMTHIYVQVTKPSIGRSSYDENKGGS